MGLAVAALGLTVVLQGPPPTVGDTVWVEIRVTVPKRHILRPQRWDLGDRGQALGPPTVTLDGDEARVRYPIAIWYPGQHNLDVPGPVIVTQDGRSDTLPNRKVAITVASVLPPGASRDTLAPKGAAALVDQSVVVILPAILFAAIGLLLFGLVYWLKERRRRRLAIGAPALPPNNVAALIGRWGEAGELRAALDGYARLIEAALARGQGGDDLRQDFRTVAPEVELVGFKGNPTADEVAPVLAKVVDLHRRLAS